MSEKSNISLINLSQQLPFQLDDKQKKDLCFAETLILSCGHYDGDIGDVSSDSEWTCRESSSTESSNILTDKREYEVPVFTIDESKSEEEDEENDFHFFFFPTCENPPLPQHSKDSVLIVDGLPKVNSAGKNLAYCTCNKDKKGECDCFVKIPCSCGAKDVADCICRECNNVCICKPLEPSPVCTCMDNSQVCTCHPDGIILPECICDKIEKPCICPAHPFTFPSPICKCKGKPKLSSSSVSSFRYGNESEYYGEEPWKEDSIKEPCECQKVTKIKELCYCKKGKECICHKFPCVCDVQPTCVCEPGDGEDIPCKEELVDNKSICSCDIPKVCTCGKTISECTCFPIKVCTCGNPEKCKCFSICDCKDPCTCDIAPVSTKACICIDSAKVPVTDIVCTCPKQEDNKLRRVRAGKHGYRWCHEVDPHHTYFDFAYGRYENIEKKEPEPEKLVIQGLHDAEHQEEVCAVHQVKAPKYEKKIRKPSLDCCSAVGGISISVETLGEDKDKFLVQVVSHSSKEGAKTGSKLVSILDCNLHTMEENRTEYIIKKNIIKERRSYMAICANGYYNKVTRVCGEKHVVKRVYHTFEQAHDFLLEGANIVLMRYFALIRFRGNIETNTVMMDGVICQSVYVCHGVSQAIVNGYPLFVVKIERHVIEPSGYVHQTLTVLTLRGYMVSHEWSDNCYMLHLNPLLQVVPERDEIELHAPLREKWREDLQLLSDYLDFKTIRTSEGGRYLTENGALTGAVRDYLQAILLLRPQDTVGFTRHYFGSALSALDLPHDEYFDPTSRHVRYYFFEE